MNKKLIKTIMENRTADKATRDILLRLPDEAYDKLKYINEHTCNFDREQNFTKILHEKTTADRLI